MCATTWKIVCSSFVTRNWEWNCLAAGHLERVCVLFLYGSPRCALSLIIVSRIASQAISPTVYLYYVIKLHFDTEHKPRIRYCRCAKTEEQYNISNNTTSNSFISKKTQKLKMKERTRSFHGFADNSIEHYFVCDFTCVNETRPLKCPLCFSIALPSSSLVRSFI